MAYFNDKQDNVVNCRYFSQFNCDMKSPYRPMPSYSRKTGLKNLYASFKPQMGLLEKRWDVVTIPEFYCAEQK